MAASRQRYTGEHADLVRALAPSCTSPGWMVYEPDVKSKLSVPLIKKYGDLLRRLEGIQENLSFTKVQMEAALQTILEDDSKRWRIKPEDAKPWVVSTAAQIRCLCRHVMNAALRKPPPAWLQKVFEDPAGEQEGGGVGSDDGGGTGDDTGTGDEGGDDNKNEVAEIGAVDAGRGETPGPIATTMAAKKHQPGDTSRYITGWDNDMRAAWRQNIGQPDRQISTDFFKQVDSEFLWARWNDGFVAEIVDVSWNQFEAHPLFPTCFPGWIKNI